MGWVVREKSSNLVDVWPKQRPRAVGSSEMARSMTQFGKTSPAAWRLARNAAFTITKGQSVLPPPKWRETPDPHGKAPALPHHAAAFSWFKHAGSRRQGFTIFNLPLRVQPSATPSRGHLFCSLRRVLLAADDLGVIGRFAQKPARHHPLDFLLELIGLIGLHPDQFGHQAAGALGGLEIAQHLLARAVLILAEPVNGAIERPAQFRSRGFVNIVAGD